MYYTDNSILPEYMAPLIITAAPYGPAWLPGDAADIPLSWDEQVQAPWTATTPARGCCTFTFAIRPPEWVQQFRRLQPPVEADPGGGAEMIIRSVARSPLPPHSADAKAKWLDYDTRHMLTELDPKPGL